MSDATPERTVGSVECPDCGEQLPLVEDAAETNLDGAVPEGGWSGVAEAFCPNCELLIADWWDGTFVFRHDEEAEAANG